MDADIVSLLAQLLALGVLSVWSVKLSVKGGFAWLFRLLAGAFVCFFLCTLFIIISVLGMGEWPGYFSSADFCLLGVYSFFLSACRGLYGKQTEEERRITRRCRFTALLAPAVAVAMHIAYIKIYVIGYFFDIDPWINNILYCIFISFTGYWALRLLLAALHGAQKKFLHFYGAILLYLGLDLLIFLFSSLAWDAPYFICVYLEIPAMFWVLLTAKKGAAV